MVKKSFTTSGTNESWDAIQNALNRLGAKGTSDDETDCKSPKRVRRVQLAFLNRQFARLFAALDTYPQEGIALKRDKRGNRHLDRIHESIHTNESRVVHNLPLNWYEGAWWRNLRQWEQDELDPQPPIPIPTLTPYVV